MSAIEPDLMRELIKAVENKLRSEPSDNKLWDASMIGAYLVRSPDYVRGQILPLPSFPAAIRLPGKSPRALYDPVEVKEWVRKHRERKSV